MKFTYEKDGIPVELIIDRERDRKRIEELDIKILHRKVNPDEIIDKRIEDYIKKERRVCEIASNFQIPKEYYDFWFAWDFDHDCWSIIEYGFQEVAEHYSSLLRSEVLRHARLLQGIEECSERLETSTDERIKKSCQESINHYKAELQAGFTEIKECRVFTEPQYFKEAVFYNGLSVVLMDAGKYHKKSSFVELFNEELSLFNLKTHKAALGKKDTVALIESTIKREVTEENYLTLWEDMGLFYARILDGEIKCVREL